MGGNPWLVSLVGYCSIAAGLLVTVVGIGTVIAFFSGGGPLGGVGMYVLAILVGGPVLVLGGPAVIFAGVRLLGGYGWGRWALEIFWWFLLAAVTGYLTYQGMTRRYILAEHVIQGALLFLATGVPAILMVVLLRSETVRRALVR